MVSVLHFCVAWAFPVLDSNDIDLQIIPAVVQVVKLGNNMWILVNMIILDIAIFLLKDCLSFPSSCNLQPPFVSSHAPMMHARWRGPIRTRTEESASMIFFPKKSPFCSIQTFLKKNNVTENWASESHLSGRRFPKKKSVFNDPQFTENALF